MSIIASPDARALHDLADALLSAQDGDIVTVRLAYLEQHAYKIDHRDPTRPVVYIAHDLTPAELAQVLGALSADLLRVADERVRPRLRAVTGTADPSAPVRPTLRVLSGGAR